ncbi:CBL-interacting serine/threonine-protein kinase 21-like [Salarias fasciatus]|uniref:CBL-interacting serine/threonine-protein kinase 21-like n=1 Tax=Salarias fasciatus TaxID=181472 RepID=UPI001176F2C4|nr:CBL-interacting serine/threonine-protein kinase 21-like [Salarias fasciatus]
MAYSTSTVAQGCFGKVYKQKYNDKWAAIKKVPYHLIDRKDLEREYAVYKKAEHPNIVKLLGDITLTDGTWVIPLEFVFGEDLETTIFNPSRSRIHMTPANQGTIIVGMCEGLLYLHSKDIVHQDLKPENIMVEHYTNRAVIIDLGLAKFFKYGLNSAADIGNEAYAAPEVLQRRVQRDQRSDVWAMGKIIAEFCAQVRLFTPSVCPTKIKETLKDQPYCRAVCRMVHPDPTLRASMAGIIDEIRVAGGKSSADQKDHQKPHSPNTDVRNRSPSPEYRGTSSFRRDYPPINIPSPPINRPFVGLLSPPSANLEELNKMQDLAKKRLSEFTNDFTKTAFNEKWKMEMHMEEKNTDFKRWEHKEFKAEQQILKFDEHTPLGGLRQSSSSNWAQNDNLTESFKKMTFFGEKRQMEMHLEEKNGDIERWEQKKVSAERQNVTFNSKQENIF